MAAEEELPYDTSTATGKLAAALITGMTKKNFHLLTSNKKLII